MHAIRDDADYAAHVGHIHLSSVKHGLATRVADWPYSSFHRAVGMGWYPVTSADDGGWMWWRRIDFGDGAVVGAVKIKVFRGCERVRSNFV